MLDHHSYQSQLQGRKKSDVAGNYANRSEWNGCCPNSGQGIVFPYSEHETRVQFSNPLAE